MTTWSIIRKDLLILTRDRRAVAVLVFMPMLFITILGLSTGRLLGSREGSALLKLVVVDQANVEVSREIVSHLEGRPGIDVVLADDIETAQMWLDDGSRTVSVVIGPKFPERADALRIADLLGSGLRDAVGGLANLDLHVHSRRAHDVMGMLTEQLLFGSAMRILAPRAAQRDPLVRRYLAARGALQEKPVNDGAVEAVTDTPPTILATGNLVYQFLVPAYAVLFAFFLINIMARSFIAERQAGTLLRLQLAPVSTGVVLLGKTVPFFLVSVVQGILLFAFGKLSFGMSWGSMPWVLPVVIACTSLAATTLGLVAATLVRTDAQVSAYANLLVIVLGGISGCFMPRDWLPTAMQKLSLLTPHAWALIAYDELLNVDSPNLQRVATCCGVLIALSVAFALLGWLGYARVNRV